MLEALISCEMSLSVREFYLRYVEKRIFSSTLLLSCPIEFSILSLLHCVDRIARAHSKKEKYRLVEGWETPGHTSKVIPVRKKVSTIRTSKRSEPAPNSMDVHFVDWGPRFQAKKHRIWT